MNLSTLRQLSYLSCLENGAYSHFFVKLDDRTKNMLGLSTIVAINALVLKHLIFPIVSYCININSKSVFTRIDISDNYYVRYIQAKDSWKSLFLILPFANFYVHYMEYKENEELVKTKQENREFNRFVLGRLKEALPLNEHSDFLNCLENYKKEYSLVGIKSIVEVLIRLPFITRDQFIKSLLNLAAPKTEIESVATTLAELENPFPILAHAIQCPTITNKLILIQFIFHLLQDNPERSRREICESFNIEFDSFQKTNADFHYSIIKISKNYELLEATSSELQEEVIAIARFYHDETVLDGLREHHFIPEVKPQDTPPLLIDTLAVIRSFLDSEDQLSFSLVSKTHYKAISKSCSTDNGYLTSFENVLLFSDKILAPKGEAYTYFFKGFIQKSYPLNQKLRISESQKMIYNFKVILVNHLKNISLEKLKLDDLMSVACDEVEINSASYLNNVLFITRLYKKYYPSEDNHILHFSLSLTVEKLKALTL